MTSTYAGFRPRPRPPGSSARQLVSPPPRLLERAEAGLAQPFKGVTADGSVVSGLFPIRKSGVSTEPIRRAAEAYLAALRPEQRAKGLFEVTDEKTWRSWSNVHPFLMRHGVCLEEMSAEQSELALALLHESLSDDGFTTARNVMKLNEFIGEITGRHEEYGQWVYWLSIMGTPSESEPWGWQIDGHHLNVNCLILGDQMVMTPMFIGSEPVAANVGPFAGISVFQTEQNEGLGFMQALPAQLQQKASLGMQHPSETAGFTDNAEIPYTGVRYEELDPALRERFLGLVELYIRRIRPGHSRVRMEEIKEHLDQTFFAWAGEWGDDAVFYYRVYSPVILIEFDHQAGIALDSDVPSRDHIHTIVRTPNGNDYGFDLLRQHHARYRHANGEHVSR
jgi:hypothetical protein